MVHKNKRAQYLVIGVPCRKCGKQVRADYSGFCMDCADELGISEMLEKSKGYKKRLSEARAMYALPREVGQRIRVA